MHRESFCMKAAVKSLIVAGVLTIWILQELILGMCKTTKWLEILDVYPTSQFFSFLFCLICFAWYFCKSCVRYFEKCISGAENKRQARWVSILTWKWEGLKIEKFCVGCQTGIWQLSLLIGLCMKTWNFILFKMETLWMKLLKCSTVV